jgi:hypothetical protein
MGILQRLRERKLLRGFTSTEVIANLQGETQLSVGKIEARHFQFVAILVDERNSEEVSATIGTVVRTLLQHEAMLSSVTSSLIVGLLGVPFPKGDSPEARRGLVEALLRENGDRIRIAHGQCDGAVGLLGTKERCTYGEIIPGFSGILKKLLDTKFGAAVDLDS